MNNDLQIKVKVMNSNTHAFAPAMLFNFPTRRNINKKDIGKIITQMKEKAVELGQKTSALGKFDMWSFRAYVTNNPYLNHKK